MEGLKAKKYFHTTRKKFDPLALVLSVIGILAVISAVGGVGTGAYLVNTHGILIVVGGTFASLLFQFDFSSLVQSFVMVFRSFRGTPEKELLGVLRQLNQTIINDTSLMDLRDGSQISGELLNDIVYMYRQGLLFEEIEEFVTSRINDEFLGRRIAASVLNRAALIAPTLGLFGTVIGLIGVLKFMSHPGQIGPSMSLALMTTAYGAAMGSLIFTPLAGRLEHHNQIFLELHKQLLSKVGILLKRDERKMDRTHTPELACPEQNNDPGFKVVA